MTKKIDIYEWPDGSKVKLCLQDSTISGKKISYLMAYLYRSSLSMEIHHIFLHLKGNGQVSIESKVVEEGKNWLEAKLAGFLMDVGLSREQHPWRPTLLEYMVKTPLFVDDDLWDCRYDIYKGIHEDYLFPGFRLNLMFHRTIDSDAPWSAHIDMAVTVGLRDGHSLRHRQHKNEVIDDLTNTLFILPSRDRERWEQNFVERGVFLHPLPDEVEIFRTLGEALPFFWPIDDLEVWMTDRILPDVESTETG